MGARYLAWFDADRKKPAYRKVEQAAERYERKFGSEPTVCLVNPADDCFVPGISVRPAAHIARHCFWVGRDDSEG